MIVTSCPGSIGLLRLPIGDDVVVGLVRGRDLDELDAPLAPLADRLDPVARPLVVMRLEVLVVLEDPVALHQAEAARVGVDEGRDRLPGRVAQRTPDPLARAGMDEQPVGIVQLGPEIVRRGAARSRPRRYIEVRGARPTIGELAPREQRRGDVEGRRLARLDVEPVGAGHRGAVEEREDRRPGRHRPSASRSRTRGSTGTPPARPPSPSTLSARPARREAVFLVPAEEAEIARAQEGDELVEDLRAC